MFKSLDIPGHNMTNTLKDTKGDLSQVNRWAGFTVGSNNLNHMENNLQVLTQPKSDAWVQKEYFNIEKLRAAANPNFRKHRPHSHQMKRIIRQLSNYEIYVAREKDFTDADAKAGFKQKIIPIFERVDPEKWEDPFGEIKHKDLEDKVEE
jgi:hypothetical protein